MNIQIIRKLNPDALGRTLFEVRVDGKLHIMSTSQIVWATLKGVGTWTDYIRIA